MDTPRPSGQLVRANYKPLLVLIFIVTVIAYAPLLGFGFVDDDHIQIIENPRIREWMEVPGFFTSSVWAHLTPSLGDLSPPYYRPLFLVWLFINYQVFGTEPLGWHMMAILLHVLVTGLAYYVVREITGDWLVSIFSAALFALHPAHVEAIAWVSAAPETLMSAAVLVSILGYQKARRTGSLFWATSSILSYGIALMAKESAIVLPAILLAYEMTLGGGRERWRFRLFRLIPYLAVGLCYCVLRRATLEATFTTAVPWASMLLTWPSLLWTYIRHMVWPVDLIAVSDLPYVTRLDMRHVILPATAVIAVLLALWIASRRRPVVAFAALWAGLLLLPPLYLRGLTSGDFAHDRYLYLPSLGLCVVAALWLSRLRRGPVIVLLLAGAGVLGIHRESKPWSDDVALFQHAAQIAPDNLRAQRQLALALATASRCSDAIPVLQRVREQEESPRILLGLSACYCSQGRLGEAEPILLRAMELAPHSQLPYMLLIGTRMAQNRLADAENLWRRAMSLGPGGGDARGFHLIGGQVLKAAGDLAGAEAEFRVELQLDPNSADAARQLDEVEWALHRPASGY